MTEEGNLVTVSIFLEGIITPPTNLLIVVVNDTTVSLDTESFQTGQYGFVCREFDFRQRSHTHRAGHTHTHLHYSVSACL